MSILISGKSIPFAELPAVICYRFSTYARNFCSRWSPRLRHRSRQTETALRASFRASQTPLLLHEEPRLCAVDEPPARTGAPSERVVYTDEQDRSKQLTRAFATLHRGRTGDQRLPSKSPVSPIFPKACNKIEHVQLFLLTKRGADSII